MTAQIIEWPLLQAPRRNPETIISQAADEHMARRLSEYAAAAIEAAQRGPLHKAQRRPLLAALEAYEGPSG